MENIANDLMIFNLKALEVCKVSWPVSQNGVGTWLCTQRLKGRLKFLSSSNGAKSIDWPLSLTGTDGSPCDSLSLLWLNLIDSQLSPQRAVKNHSANKLLALQSLLEC